METENKLQNGIFQNIFFVSGFLFGKLRCLCISFLTGKTKKTSIIAFVNLGAHSKCFPLAQPVSPHSNFFGTLAFFLWRLILTHVSHQQLNLPIFKNWITGFHDNSSRNPRSMKEPTVDLLSIIETYDRCTIDLQYIYVGPFYLWFCHSQIRSGPIKGKSLDEHQS